MDADPEFPVGFPDGGLRRVFPRLDPAADIPTREGWLYLDTGLDCQSRRIAGWSTAEHLRTELALKALDMAVRPRRPRSDELAHHSGRGCQYTSAGYRSFLAAHGISASMSRKGQCLDNAVAESVFATLKTELVGGRIWRTRKEAAQAIVAARSAWLHFAYN